MLEDLRAPDRAHLFDDEGVRLAEARRSDHERYVVPVAGQANPVDAAEGPRSDDRDAHQKRRRESTRMVTGPSLSTTTRICARNRPVATRTPRVRAASTKRSTMRSADAGSIAPSKLGRSPRRTSPNTVNWL